MMTQRVHQCEFCRASFHPRPQVKNPRACNRQDCQKKRQSSNELEWREKSGTQSDPKYHSIRKEARLKQLRVISLAVTDCFKKGATFLKEQFSGESFQVFFFSIFTASRHSQSKQVLALKVINLIQELTD